MKFEHLINNIEVVHNELHQQAIQQVNNALTIRNSLIGFYIVSYEQKGEERAEYGQSLLKNISLSLKNKGLKGFSDRSLRQFRQFYLTYPEIWQTVSAKFKDRDIPLINLKDNNLINIPVESGVPHIEPEKLLSHLSFSHFIELLRVDESLKRRFYEVESIKNAWKVRELARAIDTSLFERTGLSTNKHAVIRKIKDNVIMPMADVIKNPYLLEFLGLEEKSEYSELDLETAIIDHLQSFLTELGRGFCFESRQKRITFNNIHHRIDLVFYNRILKCHVLIDLKIGQYDHADAGQMIMYLNYYRRNEMTEGDNPPVGIILCADKDDALVEYTTEGLANEIFVSKYLLQLPSKEMLKEFIKNEMKG